MTQAQTNSTEQGGIFNTLRNRWETKVVAPAVIVMGAVGLASCAGQGEVGAAPTPDQTVSAPATEKPAPSASATPTIESTPKTEPLTGELPESLKPYETVSIEEFNALSKDEVQLPYFGALLGGMDGIRDFASDYISYTNNPKDRLPKEISENNTPEEILTIATYGERLTMALDGDNRTKATIAILEGGMASPRWNIINEALTQNADRGAMTGAMVAYAEFVQPPSSIVRSSDLQTDPTSNQKYRDITIINSEGQEQEVRAYFHSVDINGTEFNWWTEP